ncbi:acyl-CoA N-acyltransferase [Hysterangium stoloniferum]|nr:acyl-CoA N-acyltransferase [Hysterangium stoloniferum]
MEVLYKSTTVYEWNPSNKRKELFHADSRFILAVPEGKRVEEDLAAFVMFRFDTEENMAGVDENVTYCYEIQVAETCRGSGLGKNLMDITKKLAKEWRMQKVMLTVLLANTAAMRFYQREGFVIDATSPEDEGYHILSWAI